MTGPTECDAVNFGTAHGSKEMTIHMRILIVLLAVVGCMATSTALVAQTGSQSVGPGDVLQVEVYAGGEKQQDFAATISPEGTITCPLIGEFKLAGTGTTEIASELRVALARGYFVDPQVLVSVKEYGGRVFVMGEVRRPGLYALRDGPTALSACVLAGGFTDFAAPRHAKITRVEGGKSKLIVVDLMKVKGGKAPDPMLRAGDRIEIPPRLF